MSSHDITTRVVVNLLLVALGYTLKRLGIISRQDGRVLNRLVLYVTLPATSLHAIADADITWQLLLLPLIFFVVPIGLCLAGTLPARCLDLARPDRGTFIVSLCGFMASLAYPFAEAAYGVPGIQALAVCDLGNALAIFGVAYYLSFRFSSSGHFAFSEILKRIASFLPLHAAWIGLVLNLTGLRLGRVPGGLIETLSTINSPLMLISLGLYLEFRLSRQESRALLVHTLFKYSLGAGIALLLTLTLAYRGAQRAVAFLVPLMPAPLSSLVYSVEQSLNPRLAATLISLDILISLLITTVTVLAFRTAF